MLQTRERPLRRSEPTSTFQLTPGTDAALANGILHVLMEEGLIDEKYVRERTVGFDLVKAGAVSYWPGRVEGITGIPEQQIV